MLLPTGCDIAANMAARQCREIVLGAIPGIRRELPCLPAHVRFDGRQHRLELMRIAGLVRQPVGHNHLMRGIDGRLGVIALDESVLRLHHPAVWISELALRAGVGRTGRSLRRTASSRAI